MGIGLRADDKVVVVQGIERHTLRRFWFLQFVLRARRESLVDQLL